MEIEKIRITGHNLRNADVYRYQCLINDVIIGDAIVIDYHDCKELHISSVQIERSYRHRGRGSKLVKQIISQARPGYKITAYSGMDLKDFWFGLGLTRKGQMRAEGLYEYVLKV